MSKYRFRASTMLRATLLGLVAVALGLLMSSSGQAEPLHAGEKVYCCAGLQMSCRAGSTSLRKSFTKEMSA
jgi:hypothetical protein